jgi:tetratricopeptide (TPR) repeat protein
MQSSVLLLQLLVATLQHADPDDSDRYMKEGDVFFSRGEMALAEGAYRRAAVGRKSALLSHNLGICLAQQGRAAEAVSSLEQAVALSPSTAALHLSLANVLVGHTAEAGSLQKALDTYETTLRLDPSNEDAKNNLLVARRRPSIDLNESRLELLQAKRTESNQHNRESTKSNQPRTLDRAVIVEPRSHPALEPVVKHVCEKLNGLPITIVHGSANSDFAHALMERITCVDQVLELNAANLDYRTYSKLFVASEFWRKLGKDSDQVGM